eukprot:9492256-Pyramimonas_sp.AAC.1
MPGAQRARRLQDQWGQHRPGRPGPAQRGSKLRPESPKRPKPARQVSKVLRETAWDPSPEGPEQEKTLT